MSYGNTESSFVKLLGQITNFYSKTFRNIFSRYTGNDMTDADLRKLHEEDKIADENADLSYERQKEFQELYLTPEAQIKSQAAGFDAIGMNRMLLAGSQPGASASTAPQSAGGTAGSSAGSVDILGLLSNFALKSKELELAKQHVDNETKKTDAEVEGLDIRNSNLQELLDLQKGALDKKIEFMGQQIETEPVKRALLRTEIGLKQAETSVKENLSALQKIDLHYHDAYQAAQLAIAKAYAGIAETDNQFHRKILEQQIGINAKQIEIMNQTIVTGKLQNGILAKDFQYYDSDRKFNRWNTGIGTAAKVVGAVAGIAMGGASLGKVAGLFGNPLGNVPQGVVDSYNYRAAHPEKYK